MVLRVAANCILGGLLPLLVIVLSGIFADIDPANGADPNGFGEYLDSSCSAAAREDREIDSSFSDMHRLI